jgi:hypothetical protein
MEQSENTLLLDRFRRAGLSAFTRHPRAIGETYFEHLRMAFRISGQLFGAGLACAVHAVFPCSFSKSASNTIRSLHVAIESRLARGARPE